MYTICLNQNKEHRKIMLGETLDTNNFVFDENCDFHSCANLAPTIENIFSYLLEIIRNYVQKSLQSHILLLYDSLLQMNLKVRFIS